MAAIENFTVILYIVQEEDVNYDGLPKLCFYSHVAASWLSWSLENLMIGATRIKPHP